MSRQAERIILTPEHVQIRLLPAGLGSRFLAFMVDFMLILGGGTVLNITLGLLFGLILPPGLLMAIQSTLLFLLFWSYHVYFELRGQGRTPGKRMTGLRVVDGRGLPISLQQSFTRNIVRILDMQPVLFYGLGGLVCLLDRHHRRLGDIVADTLVVRESQPLIFDRQLSQARRFNSLRTPSVLRRIRNRVGLEEKEFLLTLCLRAEKMDEKARFDLMETVAAPYRKKLAIDDPHLSGENLIRDLTAILFSDKTF